MSPWLCSLLCLGLLGLSTNPLAAAVTRIALGPILPETGSEPLRPAAQQLSDSLRSALARTARFQVVPADPVQSLPVARGPVTAAASLTPDEAVLKLGRQLGADWLVTGLIVGRGSRTQVWTRVIDIEASTVTDVSALPFDAAHPQATAVPLAAFIHGAGLLTPKQHFLVLGSFAGPALARVQTALERNYLDAGFAVVPEDLAGPLLADMANHATPAAASTSGSRHLKFLPAFWLVSGETRETKAGGVPARSLSKELSALLHVQRAGGPEENFDLSAAGELELAEAAVRGVRQAMNNVKARGQANTALWQSELHRKRALERVDGPPLGNIPAGATDRRAAIDQSMRTRAESTRASFEIALAQNPNDLEAKFWVGYGNLFSTNMTEAGRGRKLLEEVAAGSQPDLAERARRTLNAAERYFPRKRPE